MNKIIFTALLLVSVTGCTTGKSSSAAPGETEWGYKKLPYDEWKFLFIYPKALPALATQALMVDGAGYKTTYRDEHHGSTYEREYKSEVSLLGVALMCAAGRLRSEHQSARHEQRNCSEPAYRYQRQTGLYL
ncbi:lipoprotein [Buttiauxella noackiae]|uniref:lipoprotein n=1 Tax=Buttiauxella noackiae TaxID=82992 RepID=UPI0035A64A4E